MNIDTFMRLGLDVMSELKNLNIEGKIKVNKSFYLSMAEGFTTESLIGIFEAFEDNTDDGSQCTCYIGSTMLQKLNPEQISIVTNKNILLA